MIVYSRGQVCACMVTVDMVTVDKGDWFLNETCSFPDMISESACVHLNQSQIPLSLGGVTSELRCLLEHEIHV